MWPINLSTILGQDTALAKANLDNFCLESLISAIEEKYGISVKKNSGLKELRKDEKQ